MSALEINLIIMIAIVLVALAVYCAYGQRATFRAVHFDAKLSTAQRRYLIKQASRRLFGSLLLVVLAGMLIGSIFLDYDLIQMRGENEPIPEAAKQTFRIISFYWMATLLVLLVIVFLAVIDLLATTRFAFQQQKQLAIDHQLALAAELARLKED